MPTELLKVEISGPQNQQVYFQPLMRTLRGRFDLARVPEPNAGKLRTMWPEPIPGQVIELDPLTGQGAIVERLYEPAFAAIRANIEAMGQKLPPEREPFTLDVPTAIYWIGALIEGGTADVLSGTLPKLTGVPMTRFHSSEPADPLTKLQTAFEQQTAMLAKLVESVVQLAAAKK